jgi:hypothetical protein
LFHNKTLVINALDCYVQLNLLDENNSSRSITHFMLPSQKSYISKIDSEIKFTEYVYVGSCPEFRSRLTTATGFSNETEITFNSSNDYTIFISANVQLVPVVNILPIFRDAERTLKNSLPGIRQV